MTSRSFQLKLERAAEHATALGREVRAWSLAESDPFFVTRTADARGPVLEYRFRPGIVVDPRWSLLLGDWVHNLRSALDHLALDLAETHSGPLSEAATRTSEFPIIGPRQMTASGIKAKIGHVAPAAQAAIAAMQPHLAANYRRHPLWLVHALDVVDKHRLVHAVAAMSSGISVEREGELLVSRSLEIDGGRADSTDPVVVVRFDAGDDVSAVSHFHMPLHVAFDGGPAGDRSVLDTVRILQGHVRDQVIAPLAVFL